MESFSARSESLDGWRGVACLLVHFYHCGASLYLGEIAFQGFVGVHLFFILSGLFIFQPFAQGLRASNREFEFGVYFHKRFWRIFPPYLVSLTFFTVLRVFFSTKSGVPSAGNIVSHAFLVFNYGPGDWFFSINDVFWTLAVEAQFYVLLPLSVWTFLCLKQLLKVEVHPQLVVLVFLICGVASRILEILSSERSTPVAFSSIFSYLDMFSGGMFIACLGQHTLAKLAAFAGYIQTCGLLCIIAGASWAHSYGSWQKSDDVICGVLSPLVIAFGATLAVLGSCAGDSFLNRMLRWRPLAQLGVISYSVYLYHTGVQYFVFQIPFPPTLNWTLRAFAYAILSLPPTLAVAYVMFLFVEKPSLKMARSRHFSAVLYPPRTKK